MSVIESEFMPAMEGTEVTTRATSWGLQPTTWVIHEKIIERAYFSTKEDHEHEWGPPHTAAKFRCYDKSDPARKLAFMRIYRQVPIGGTEWTPLATRAAQAIPQKSYLELEASKLLKQQNCPDVPHLLGYHEGQQPADAPVPGGFTSTVVWETLPGSPLSLDPFWEFDRAKRDLIRAEFRSALSQVMQCGVYPTTLGCVIRKIIYDATTGSLKIAGFRDYRTEWDEFDKRTAILSYGLAKFPNPKRRDWNSDPSTWIL